ncbi:sesquipedalian-1-like [Myripristis murdjan]|uniref:Sesquipedalian n=1 Tax=Myripristis murdjan TaxID=586833 RepID=A0A668AHD6_9TELE|nr:sesquipedalian-1-like [Myripristis murdjan]XP_029932980.1 sesquipedalian-1-like [Myripristis murdjan]
MKIHGKILSYFESCNSPVDKEGYLNKKGERNTSYQKRWCVLKGNLLFYKERHTDRDLLGVIVLEGCTVQLCESEEQFAFSLVWSEPGLRTYKFAAEDQASQESWIKALLSATHSYLFVLVMDLQKQYQEAMKMHPSDSAKSLTLPGNSTAEAAPPPAWLSTGTSTLPVCPGPGVGAGSGFTANPRLQAPPVPSKTGSKRSPKIWPKRPGNVAPVNGPAPPMAEWSAVGVITKEEFSKLHQEFGKEVKELIADWSKRGKGAQVVEEEDLIDFG